MSIKDHIGACVVHPRAAAPALPAIGHTLSDVYGTWSAAKQNAYNRAFKLMQEVDGCNFRITSRNRYGFCVAFDCVIDGREMRIHITPYNTHAYYIREENGGVPATECNCEGCVMFGTEECDDICALTV